jgi:hypothetical protein
VGLTQPRPSSEAEREQAFIDELRRDDVAVADRYVALRDARALALADLRRVETQYNAGGSELRGLFTRSLVEARRKYAETSLALLDFFDDQDRRLAARYQNEIGRINAAIEERQKTRAEMEKLLTR